MKKFYISLLLSVYAVISYGKIDAESISIANDLKTKYTEDNIALVNSNSNLSFSKSGKNIIASNKHNDEFISLSINKEIYRRLFYDDKSEISYVSTRNNKNKSIYVPSKCGNYESEGIFHSDVMMCIYELGFYSKGQRINFAYTKTYNDLKFLNSIYFHSEYPTRDKEITIKIPEWLEVEIKEFNFDGYNIVKDSTFNSKNKSKTYTYKLSDLEAFERFDNQRGYAHTYPHLIVLCKSTSLENTETELLANTSDQYNWYYSLIKDLKYDNDNIKNVVDKLVSDTDSDYKKMEKIFYWVQDNIRYIAFEDGIAGFKPEEAYLVLENKYGDCKGMANLTKAMLNYVNIDARLTWLGTNKVRYDYSMPSLLVDNHVICTAILDGKRVYIDPTEKYICSQRYAERIQGRPVLIEDGKSFILDTIPENDFKSNLSLKTFNLKLNDNTLSGKCTFEYNGEIKTNYLGYINSSAIDKQSEMIEEMVTRDNRNISAENITNSSLNNREAPFTVESEISFMNKVTEFDGSLYVDFDPYHELMSNKIDTNQISNYYFGSKQYYKTHVTIEIPEKYKVANMPENLLIDNDEFQIKAKFKVENNVIYFEKDIITYNSELRKESFVAWNSAIDQLKNVINNQIVLTQ